MENDFNGYNELTFIGSGYTSYVYVLQTEFEMSINFGRYLRDEIM